MLESIRLGVANIGQLDYMRIIAVQTQNFPNLGPIVPPETP